MNAINANLASVSHALARTCFGDGNPWRRTQGSYPKNSFTEGFDEVFVSPNGQICQKKKKHGVGCVVSAIPNQVKEVVILDVTKTPSLSEETTV
jgi:hypothetical protein